MGFRFNLKDTFKARGLVLHKHVKQPFTESIADSTASQGSVANTPERRAWWWLTRTAGELLRLYRVMGTKEEWLLA